MTTTHTIQPNDDGSHTYRGHRISRLSDNYFVGWYRSIKPAPTMEAITANIDAHIAAEEKAWKPVLRQDGTYCSPRCGFKCTKANHDEAQRKGEELAKRMGQGWRARVWENGMWHYSAVLDIDGVGVSVHHGYEPGKARDGHREGIDEYTCYLNTNPQFIGRDTDPCKAFAKARHLLAAHIANLRDIEARLGPMVDVPQELLA